MAINKYLQTFKYTQLNSNYYLFRIQKYINCLHWLIK